MDINLSEDVGWWGRSGNEGAEILKNKIRVKVLKVGEKKWKEMKKQGGAMQRNRASGTDIEVKS